MPRQNHITSRTFRSDSKSHLMAWQLRIWVGAVLIKMNMKYINCPCCNSEIELKKTEKFDYVKIDGKKVKVVHKNVCAKTLKKKSNE